MLIKEKVSPLLHNNSTVFSLYWYIIGIPLALHISMHVWLCENCKYRYPGEITLTDAEEIRALLSSDHLCCKLLFIGQLLKAWGLVGRVRSEQDH